MKADQKIDRSMKVGYFFFTATRPNIIFAASCSSRFMQSLSQHHLEAAKRLLRYVKGKLGDGVQFEAITTSLRVAGFTDSDWAGSLDDMKSTSGYTFTLGK